MAIAAADQSVWPPGWHSESNHPDKSWRIACMLHLREAIRCPAAQPLTDWWIDKLFKEPFIPQADHAALMDG